nr:hypothetical protein [Morchella crassipes]
MLSKTADPPPGTPLTSLMWGFFYIKRGEGCSIPPPFPWGGKVEGGGGGSGHLIILMAASPPPSTPPQFYLTFIIYNESKFSTLFFFLFLKEREKKVKWKLVFPENKGKLS